MFSFFRRQSKKTGDCKKSDGKKTKNCYINNLQCVPVDKYEIDFSRIVEEKPERAPRTTTSGKCVTMGNSESSRKNENSAAIRSDSSNNVYERRKTETDFSRWSNEYKDEINKNKHLQQNGKTPENKNELDINEKPSHVPPSELKGDQQSYEWKTSTDKPSTSSESLKCYNCVVNGCSQKRDDLRCEKTDISAKSESELKKCEKLFANEDVVNKDVADESLNTLYSLSTSFNSVMTNGTECAQSSCDKYTKQREHSAEMSPEEDHEDGFDTAPSSPTSEAIGINQNTKKIITARERFLSLDPQPSENINLNSFTEPERVEVQDDKFTSDEAQVAGCATCDDKTDGNCNENGCEVSVQNDSKSYFEEAESGEQKVQGKSVVSLNMKEEIQKLPQRVEEFVNLKKSRRQIPDITITESSDSENESSEEEEMEDYPNCYERAYPTILYDITEVDEPFSDASDMEFNSFAEDDKRNIVHQESKFQDQIKTLKCEIETKDTENMQLRGKINDLQREITNKTWGMDRLNAELASFQTEADCVRKKLLKVEEDLNKYKTKNTELNEELLKKSEYESDFKKVGTLQNEIDILKVKILELQTELENVKKDKEELQAKLNEMESEKNEKIKTLQMALDDTLKQKQKMQARFEEEYEKLRTVNSDREQQLLNDFEWKLREVELTCKKKLEDKDKANEDKIKQAKEQLQSEINELKKQIQELEKLKTFEAEVTQLRGLTHEQQRSMRMANRATEQLQTNERVLNVEIERLRSSLEKERSHLATVQGIHSREIAEKDRKHSFKLEQQKNEINTEWEDKFRRETTRLKLEMEKSHKEEKRNLMEDGKTKTEKQLKENCQSWEKKLLDSKKQLEELEQKLVSKEESYRKELLRLQTNSDRDMLELRRKLDKMDLAYQEQLEKQQERHEQELETMRENCDKKIQQSEQNWSQQISSTRATLELVKEQLQREAKDQLEALSKKYMLQLEQQYERLITEKEEVIAKMQEKYSTDMYDLQNQLNEELKAQKSKEDELLAKISQLEEEIYHRNQNESEIQQNVDSLHTTISELQDKISTYANLSKEANALLRKKEIEHNEAISEMKERYENEMRQCQSKFTSSNKESKSSDNATKSEESNASNIDRHSRSSRRKGRGRHKGQKNQHQQQYNHQFSSSSL